MIYKRLDGQVRAKVLHVANGRVLFDAMWQAKSDREKRDFFCSPNGSVRNTVETSTRYFKEKYGVDL